MYVALLKTMDRMQKVFVDKVDREYVPNLRKFRRESEVRSPALLCYICSLHSRLWLMFVRAMCDVTGHYS